MYSHQAFLSFAPGPRQIGILVWLVFHLVVLGVASAEVKVKEPVDDWDPHLDIHNPASMFLALSRASRQGHSMESDGVRGVPGVDVPLEGHNETTEAVNPLNSLNIAYASLFELRVSTDGGATWQDPVSPTLPQTHVAQGDPGLAFDAQGRLFWCYIASPLGPYIGVLGYDVFIARCDPLTGQILAGYPTNVTEQIGLPASIGHFNDKAWLVADAHVGSPFANRLYLAWTNLSGVGVVATHSSNQGLSWEPAVVLAVPPAFNWPSHTAVAPNGDVYVAYHRQPTDVADGISGSIEIYRSTNGGVSFPQLSTAFPAGRADMTFNRQLQIGAIPGTDFLLLGSVQPWILPDPNVSGRVYVVANDDPDNNLQSGDAADVLIARSTDHGVTWSPPLRVDDGPGTTFQVMPTAAIDPVSGAIVVQYYDNRSGALNSRGNFLLDVYATVSTDAGQSFMPDFQVNDAPFDPDAGARCRFDCGPFILDVWAGGAANFAVTDASQLLSGNPWSIVGITGAPMYAVWGTSPTNVLMCGAGGRIRRYDGVQVIVQASNTANDLYAMDGRGAGDVYAVGRNGTIAHYNGTAWSVVQQGFDHLRDVWANPAGDVWAVGKNTILRYYDGMWHAQNPLPPSTAQLGVIWGSSDDNVYVTSWNGLLYHWNGSTWEGIDLGFAATSVWGTSADDIVAVGFGRISHFDGSTWNSEDVSEHFLLRLHGTGPDDILVAGEGAFIAHYDGTEWTPQNSQVSPFAPTFRIGEYNGVAIGGSRSYAVWCGNTQEQVVKGGFNPHDQQAIFDSFQTTWQEGVSIVDLSARVPEVVLEHVRPNPVSRAATVTYALPRASAVDLTVTDVQGRRIATLIHGNQPAGRHLVSWNGKRQGGTALAAGIYFIQLRVGTETRTERLTLLP